MTTFEKQIAKELGTTPAGLRGLAKAISREINGEEARVSGCPALGLRTRGLCDADNIITDKGRELLAQARAKGW